MKYLKFSGAGMSLITLRLAKNHFYPPLISCNDENYNKCAINTALNCISAFHHEHVMALRFYTYMWLILLFFFHFDMSSGCTHEDCHKYCPYTNTETSFCSGQNLNIKIQTFQISLTPMVMRRWRDFL